MSLKGIDAAALAGGGNIDAITRDEDMKMFFDANYPEAFLGSALVDFTIAASGDNVTLDVSATVDVPTTFARVIGFDTIRIMEENRARLSTRGMELAQAHGMNSGMLFATRLSPIGNGMPIQKASGAIRSIDITILTLSASPISC